MRPGAARPARFSLRRRLIWQFVALSALLVLALFFAVRFAAERASRASQDAVLGAAVISIGDGLRPVDEGLELDLPYATFSMLGAMGDERVFYSLSTEERLITGYGNLPPAPEVPGDLSPVFWDADYRGNRLRLAAISRRVLVDTRIEEITVVLGQTRYGQAAIARETARSSAWIGLGFFVLALPLALWAARAVIRPVDRLAKAVARRGPHDLRPVRHPTPQELLPLVGALNGFIARLRGTLALAETFIFEAAHRIRTPLSLVRTEAEIALAETSDEATRQRLRRMVRAIGESSRSANQILDHATVLYRSDQFSAAPVDFAALSAAVLQSVRPIAEMREIDMRAEGLDAACQVSGDERMIEVALRNILDNALKYSRDEGEVLVRLTRRDGMAELTVLDEGRGLGPGDDDLTARFRRGSNVGDVVGSGLGLTIVNEVAAAHGGRFTLKSRAERGTCAILFLPLSEPPSSS
ncbi:sensor histidine kinase [Paracoccus saliphilus]|uniref:histidine kinase n=1 Tax=Paracoccus saliphilus TaxID=405559 RepID=A0AA45W336_9RHOB|nr:sensor histidine kinase [Paracoccus saliphilus]WCR04937.1 sensor histidine kinase [Paracoccus saliphilus]SIS72332.1 two-component system, OmpR family, sensor histidine kinase TctE [Paracoccus saliphilus]